VNTTCDPRDPTTVETQAFGSASQPGVPAPISARSVPIVPGFIRMEEDLKSRSRSRVLPRADIREEHANWVSNFEHAFRRYPYDWAFMLDNMARVSLPRPLGSRAALAKEGSNQTTQLPRRRF